MKLNNTDLQIGKIDKDPSRIIFSDIMTIDKARLGRKIGILKKEKLELLSNSIKKHLAL